MIITYVPMQIIYFPRIDLMLLYEFFNILKTALYFLGNGVQIFARTSRVAFFESLNTCLFNHPILPKKSITQ